MKGLIYIPILFIFLFSCKKDKIYNQPDEIMKPLVGKWYLVEIEQIVNGVKVWVPFTSYKPVYTNFRFDGIETDENGKASCCLPKIYYINKERYIVVPKSEVSYNFDCSLVDCMPCASRDIEVSGNQMMISCSSSSRSKYLRAD